MKKRLWLLPLALIAVVGLFISCEEIWTEPNRLAGNGGSEPVKFDIVAGKTQDAGDILVWNSADYVVVQTRTDDPWLMTQRPNKKMVLPEKMSALRSLSFSSMACLS